VIETAEIVELFARFTRALDRGLDWATQQGLFAGGASAAAPSL
jgi:hypothetical protein